MIISNRKSMLIFCMTIVNVINIIIITLVILLIKLKMIIILEIIEIIIIYIDIILILILINIIMKLEIRTILILIETMTIVLHSWWHCHLFCRRYFFISFFIKYQYNLSYIHSTLYFYELQTNEIISPIKKIIFYTCLWGTQFYKNPWTQSIDKNRYKTIIFRFKTRTALLIKGLYI